MTTAVSWQAEEVGVAAVDRLQVQPPKAETSVAHPCLHFRAELLTAIARCVIDQSIVSVRVYVPMPGHSRSACIMHRCFSPVQFHDALLLCFLPPRIPISTGQRCRATLDLEPDAGD